MIADTLAAYAFTGTRFVAAIARLEILFFHAVHGILLYCIWLVLLIRPVKMGTTLKNIQCCPLFYRMFLFIQPICLLRCHEGMPAEWSIQH
jgi:hypothetical protein